MLHTFPALIQLTFDGALINPFPTWVRVDKAHPEARKGFKELQIMELIPRNVRYLTVTEFPSVPRNDGAFDMLLTYQRVMRGAVPANGTVLERYGDDAANVREYAVGFFHVN